MKDLLLFFILSASFFFAACEQPNSQPEATDEAYLAAGNLKQELDKKIEEEEKKTASVLGEMKEANPQSGLLRTSRMHYFDSLGRVESMKQMSLFYEIKQKLRAEEVQREYLTHFYAHDGRQVASDSFTQDEKKRHFNSNWRAEDRRTKYLPKKNEKKSEKAES